MAIRVRGAKNAYNQGFHSAGMGYRNPYLKSEFVTCNEIARIEKAKAWDRGLEDGEQLSNPEYLKSKLNLK